VIDVEWVAVEDEGGNGFDSGAFGVGQARFVVAEMDNLHVEPITVQSLGDISFGIDANGATSMIEDSFCFHEPIVTRSNNTKKRAQFGDRVTVLCLGTQGCEGLL
jgi:hypothetical protein